MRVSAFLLIGTVALAAFIKTPPKPDPNRHALKPAIGVTAIPSAGTHASSSTSTTTSSTTTETSTTTSSTTTETSSITSKSSVISTSSAAQMPISSPTPVKSFDDILRQASQAPMDINAFNFTDARCTPGNFARADFCEQVAKAVVESTEAYTSVFSFPMKINIRMSVHKKDASRALADCVVARTFTVEQTNNTALSRPMASLRHLRWNETDQSTSDDRRYYSWGFADMILNIYETDEWFWFPGDAEAERKYDLRSTILHELAHGMGMYSGWIMYVYKGKRHLVPTIRSTKVYQPSTQQFVYKKVLSQTIYDQHVKAYGYGGERIDFKQDIIKLSQLLAPDGNLESIAETDSPNMGLDTWPEAALEFSENLAFWSNIDFQSDANQTYSLDTAGSNQAEYLVTKKHVFSHLSSLSAYVKDAIFPKKDFIMAPFGIYGDVSAILEDIYGRANVPLKEAIGPAMRDILSSLGWKLRE